jgi:ribonuclease-3
LGLNEFLLLSRGEEKSEGKARTYILADVCEAVIGALYLDQGYKACQDFIEENIMKELPRILEEGLYKDAKSRFQEEAQERVGVTPTYRVRKEWGPDHAKHFIIGIYLENEMIAEGEGSSKQEAEEQAAQKALAIKNW